MLFKLRIHKAQRPKVTSQKQFGQGKSVRGESTLITYFSIFTRSGSFLVPQLSWDTLTSMEINVLTQGRVMQIIRRPIRERIGGGEELAKRIKSIAWGKKRFVWITIPLYPSNAPELSKIT